MNQQLISTRSDLRLPPQNLDAEQGVIGSILLMNQAIDDLAAIITADDFYLDANRILYAVICDMYRGGCRAVDAVTLSEELIRRNQFEAVGGALYVAQVLEAVPNAAHCRYYANIVREKARLRAVIYLCNATLQKAYETSDTDELIAELDSRTMRLRDAGSTAEVQTLADAVDELEQYERNPAQGGKTGLVDLDAKLTNGGFCEAQSIVVAGRPGHGKSVLVAQFAHEFAARGESVLVVSLEMLKREIAGRYDQTVGREKLRKLPVYFDDSTVNATKIASRIRYHHRRFGIRLAVVDYLQLIEPDDKRAQRERQVADISRSMKLLAKELRIPIVLACQLNRQSANEKRKPRLSDLRESGTLEHDADIVLLLHEDEDGDSSIIVAKQRGGPTGDVPVVFQKNFSVFASKCVSDGHRL